MKQGEMMHRWAQRLWPLDRSITGRGVRTTLGFIRELLPPLQIHAVRSGTRVGDWTIPPEWHCEDAYIVTPEGDRICDYKTNNLHLVGYSTAVDEIMPLAQLRQHLHTLPDQPDYIPYITSYYAERWGFCMSHNDYLRLTEGDYSVVVDSDHFDGVLNYADLLIRGQSEKEILLSSYICHPSMANNELSGPVLLAALGQYLLQNQSRLRYSYRLILAPETIGAVTYLNNNHDHLCDGVIGGYQITTVGDDRSYSHVESPYADTISDSIARDVLSRLAPDYITYPFLKRGSDERQYCAPHVRLPIASICRSKYGEYPEYHTSADDLVNVVTAEGLQGAYDVYLECIKQFEQIEDMPVTQKREVKPGCPTVCCIGEPQLGKCGLYDSLSTKATNIDACTLLNVITYCDGSNTVDEIASLIKVSVDKCNEIIDTLARHELVNFNTEAAPQAVSG